MTYYLYDENGYVGDLASIGGWEEIADILGAENDPILDDFVNMGFSPDPEGLKAALDAIKNPALDHLKELIAKCKGEVAVQDE